MTNYNLASLAGKRLDLKSNFLFWMLVVVCAVVFTMTASFLTTGFIVGQAMKIESGRIAHHLRMVVQSSFSQGTWENPWAPEAAEIYKKILQSKMLVKIERLRALRVRDSTGAIVWSSLKGDSGVSPDTELPKEAKGGRVVFGLNVANFSHTGHEDSSAHSGARTLKTFVPVWRAAGSKKGPSDIVFEVYSEPGYLFEQKDIFQSRVRLIIGLGSSVILLILLGGVHWYGRIQKEERLTREFLNSVVNDAADAIIITNHEAKIIYWNPAAEEMFGYKKEEIIGQSIDIVIPEDQKRMRAKSSEKVFRSGEGISFEQDRIRKNGTLVPMSITLSPIRDDDEKVIAVAGVHKDLTERVESEDRLRFQANFDTLTNLPNRAMAMNQLCQTLALAKRENRNAALLFVDLDRFKNVNDTLGHAAGDRVLIEASRRLKSCIRKSDTLAFVDGDPSGEMVARFGGDEFLVILPEIRNGASAEAVARRILDVYSKPFVVEGHEFFLTASVGLAVYPADGADPHALMQNADTALYQAKESERNTYRFFDPKMNERAVERMKMETRMRNALGRREFFLHYQPIINIQTGELTGAEALLRWENPELGLVSPLRFIPVAEETGLIVSIGEWALKAACMDAKDWQTSGGPPFRVGVNVSARQLQGEKFLGAVSVALEESGLSPGCLELEITEGLLMDEREDTIPVFKALGEMGTSLTLDDFGTGYSSLSYLKKYPFNSLKIDRTFVRDVTVDPEDAALATAIAGMAHGLNLEVIGEGVEFEDQLNFLLSLGCESAQGYLFSKPLTQEEFLEFQKNWSPQPTLVS